MYFIYAELPNDSPKKITVSDTTGCSLRKAIKHGYKELKGTSLNSIKFEGFKMRSLDSTFFVKHSSKATSLKIVINNRISDLIMDSVFEAEGQLLQLSKDLRVSPKIYVRDCYMKIWETYLAYERKQLQLQLNHPHLIPHAYLSGTPGIGKTAFLPFLIDILLKAKRQVIFGSRDLIGFLYWKSKSEFETIKEDDIQAHLRNKDIFFLMDSRNFWNTLGPCIIYSSPRSDIAKQFRKTACKLYMPVWEWKEIQKLQDAVYSDLISKTHLAARFLLLGGVPRYLFEDLDIPAAKLLIFAVNESDPSHLKRLFESKGENGEEISHRLVHQDSSEYTAPPFREVTLRYASCFAVTLIAQKYKMNRRDSVVQWLDETSESGIAGGLRGNLFENIGHLQLKRGGLLQTRDLKTGNLTQVSFGSLVLNCVDRSSIDTMSWTPGFYYKPLSKTFECVDSWAMIDGELWGFQFSVSTEHKISSALYWYYKKWNLKRYVTVVYDLDKFKNFKAKNITPSNKKEYPNVVPDGFDVRQYVLLLDCKIDNISELWDIQKAEFNSFVGSNMCEQTSIEYQAILDVT